MSHKVKSYCLKFSLVSGFVLLCLIGKGQYNFEETNKILAANTKALGSDVVMLIYKAGKIIYQKDVGEFTATTKAPIASCSKWLTAALVMTFVDEGKLSLDDRVSSYIPVFEQYGKSFITIRQCLSHQTGIADNNKVIARILDRRKFETLEEEVNSFAKREIAADPGTSFFYGNIGLNIAGRVLEVISNKRFDFLMKQRLFIPLNMKNSSFTPERLIVNPSGGAVSTAGDYMNFLIMLLGKGMFNGQRVLSEQSVEQMGTVQTSKAAKKYTPKAGEGYEYGLGEWIQEADSTGNGTVASSPGLFGTWPYIDRCRDYASILFVKTWLGGEQKKDIYLQLKQTIDQQIPSSCK